MIDKLIPPQYRLAAKVIGLLIVAAALLCAGAWIEHNRLTVAYQAEKLKANETAIAERDKAVQEANDQAKLDQEAAVKAAVDAENRRKGQAWQAAKVEQSIAAHVEYRNCELVPDDFGLLKSALGGSYE